MKNAHVWDTLLPHQREAVEAGRSTPASNGDIVDAEYFGIASNSGATATLDADSLNRQLSARIEELEAALAAYETATPSRLDDGPVASEAQLHGLIESLIPDSESGIKNLSKEKVEGIAEYYGLPVEGKDKAALVAGILKVKTAAADGIEKTPVDVAVGETATLAKG